jgi:ABC-type nitrate/sulfonate/bicarbonate transport system substrate-binding protein
MRLGLRFGLALAVGLVACTTAPGQAPTPTPGATQGGTAPPATSAPTGAGEVVQFKFGTSSPESFPDAPNLAAFDDLRENENIDVEFISFSSGDDTIRALVAGQVDLGAVFPSGIMAAAAEGTVKLFFNGKNNEWSLVCRSDITSPEDLTGARIGRHSPNDLTAALVNNTIEKYGVEPELLTIPGSENRVVALLEDQIDCSPIDIAGLFVLEAERAGGFEPIIRYKDEMPDLIVTQHHVGSTSSMERNPDAWKTLTTYLVKHYRMSNDDPEYLAEIADRYFPEEDSELHAEQAQAYGDFEAFTRDGGLHKDQMDRLIEFYVEAGALEEASVLPFEEYATTEFVDYANEQLGE